MVVVAVVSMAAIVPARPGRAGAAPTPALHHRCAATEPGLSGVLGLGGDLGLAPRALEVVRRVDIPWEHGCPECRQ